MFVLRQYNSEGLESNTVLGSHYDLVELEKIPEVFNSVWKTQFDSDPGEIGESDHTRNVAAFIISPELEQPKLLFKNTNNFIMLGNGKTFTRLFYS